MRQRLSRLISAAFVIGVMVSISTLASAFNNITFNPVAQTGSSQTINQVTSSNRETNNTQNFGGRSVQLVARISW